MQHGNVSGRMIVVPPFEEGSRDAGYSENMENRDDVELHSLHSQGSAHTTSQFGMVPGALLGQWFLEGLYARTVSICIIFNIE